jgi:heme-degrading monooxygenase HmoA
MSASSFISCFSQAASLNFALEQKGQSSKRRFNMVITILEAHVAPENAATLETVFKSRIRNLDPGIVETFLVHSPTEQSLWRIMTVWESQEALARMRNSGETPAGVVMFREAKAEPTLSIFSVSAHGNR